LATTAVVLAIELDDLSHDREGRQTRDEFVDDVLAGCGVALLRVRAARSYEPRELERSEEHTSELQSRFDVVCRLLLEKINQTGALFLSIAPIYELLYRKQYGLTTPGRTALDYSVHTCVSVTTTFNHLVTVSSTCFGRQ